MTPGSDSEPRGGRMRLLRPVLVRVARRAMQDRFTRAEARAIVDDAFADYERARSRLPREEPAGPRLMVHLAALTAGFYRALCARGLDESEARRRTGDITWAVYEKMGDVPWALAGVGGPAPRTRLQRATDLFRRFPFSEPGYHMVDVASDPDVVGFDVRRCPVAEYLRAEGLGELCVQTWCDLDFGLAVRWGARLERTQTIAGGADHCDFRWRVVDESEDP